MLNVKHFDSTDAFFTKFSETNVFYSAMIVILLGQLLIVNFGGKMFNVVPLTTHDWTCIIGGTSLVFIGGLLFRAVKTLVTQK